MRLYGVSKSNLVESGAGARAAPAAAASELPGVTAPTSAVSPAFLRNDLRFSPSFCDMRMLLVWLHPRLPSNEEILHLRTPGASTLLQDRDTGSGPSPDAEKRRVFDTDSRAP